MTGGDGEDGGAYRTWRSRPGPGGDTARLRLLRVVGVGKTRPAAVLLERGALVIGREKQGPSSLVLADREVSRLHAEVVHDPGSDGWTIVDRGSSNGTIVNAARVTRQVLRHGSVIRVGRTLLLYVEIELRAGETLEGLTPSAVGESVQLLRVHAEAALVAPHPTPVLVTGETGVGKEVVAREIHRRSGRDGAFVPVNCAAIPPSLAESELFGHLQGAFTGASRASGGLFVAADKGTIFLDEIGEMTLDLQPKLLRVLASREVRAVGSTSTQSVDVRVLAATNRDLEAAVASGAFRADLYARLRGYTIHVPPLRERRDDIVPLAVLFAGARDAPPLSVDAAEALLLHDWPLNVRELELVVEAAAVRAASAEEIRAQDLPREIAARLGARAQASPAPEQAVAPPLTLLVSRDGVPTKEELVQVLERLDGNIAKVAAFFGKERQQIYRWAKRYELELESFRK
jgi:transcriptional regulator with GAF, ATPase, and Fis domain